MLDSNRSAETPAGLATSDSPGARGDATGRLAFLDALRGLGALGITCYHIHRYRPLEIPDDHFLPKTVQFIVRHGWCSVQVFWVIAGFVVAYSLRKTAVEPASFGNFSLRRILRLGMPYWTAILLVTALDILTKHFFQIDPNNMLVDDAITWQRLTGNLAFLQDILHLGNISAGTWFVCVDLQFGLLFMLMLGLVQWLSGRMSGDSAAGTNAAVLMAVFLPLGLAGLFFFNVASYDYSPWAVYYFHMPLFGAMAWWALEGRISRKMFWLFAAAMLGGIAYRSHLGLDYKKGLDVSVALIAGVTIYLVGRRGHLGDWLTTRSLQYLGRISYSLYLIHYATSWIVVSIGCRLTPDNPQAAVGWMALGVLVSIGAADLFYRFVESPSLRLVKRLKTDA